MLWENVRSAPFHNIICVGNLPVVRSIVELLILKMVCYVVCLNLCAEFMFECLNFYESGC